MRQVLTASLRLLRREDGPTAVEYAAILGLVVIVGVAAVTSLGFGVAKPVKSQSKSASIGGT